MGVDLLCPNRGDDGHLEALAASAGSTTPFARFVFTNNIPLSFNIAVIEIYGIISSTYRSTTFIFQWCLQLIFVKGVDFFLEITIYVKICKNTIIQAMKIYYNSLLCGQYS